MIPDSVLARLVCDSAITRVVLRTRLIPDWDELPVLEWTLPEEPKAWRYLLVGLKLASFIGAGS